MQGLKIRLLSYFFRIHQTNIHTLKPDTHIHTRMYKHTHTHIYFQTCKYTLTKPRTNTHDCFRQTPVLMARWNSYSQHSPTPSCQNHCSFWTSCKRTAALQCTSTHMHTHTHTCNPSCQTHCSFWTSCKRTAALQCTSTHMYTHTHIRATLPAKTTAVSGSHVRGQQRVNQRLTGHQAD